jgi:hypothetical protein
MGFLNVLLRHILTTIPEADKRRELWAAATTVRTKAQLPAVRTVVAEKLSDAKVRAKAGTLPDTVAPWFRNQLLRD